MNQAAQWYKALVRDCALSPASFQLANGNIPIGAVSTALWSMLDVVPPDSIENYDPDPASVFSSGYGAILTSLNASPLVTAAQQSWHAAGGFTAVKAYDRTKADLDYVLPRAPGATVTMTVGKDTPDLRDTWATGAGNTTTSLFLQPGATAGRRAASSPPPGSTVEVTFDHVLSFPAAPLSKVDLLNVDLKSYMPWYNDAALKLALADRTAWTDPKQWRVFFGAGTGSMLRRITGLVIVDGVRTVTRPPVTAALRSTPGDFQDTIPQPNEPIGFWPFDVPPLVPSSNPPVRPMVAAGSPGVTFSSKPGNPLLLGVNVKSLAT